MKRVTKLLNVLILTLRIARIIWNYYDAHADSIRELIADAQQSLSQMRAARDSLAHDAGRDLAMRAFARLRSTLEPEQTKAQSATGNNASHN